MGHIGYWLWIVGWGWAANEMALNHPLAALGAIVLAAVGFTLWIEWVAATGRSARHPGTEPPPESKAQTTRRPPQH